MAGDHDRGNSVDKYLSHIYQYAVCKYQYISVPEYAPPLLPICIILLAFDLLVYNPSSPPEIR